MDKIFAKSTDTIFLQNPRFFWIHLTELVKNIKNPNLYKEILKIITRTRQIKLQFGWNHEDGELQSEKSRRERERDKSSVKVNDFGIFPN